LLVIFGVLEDDGVARGVDEFAFADDGAEGSFAAGSHQADWLDACERQCVVHRSGNRKFNIRNNS